MLIEKTATRYIRNSAARRNIVFGVAHKFAVCARNSLNSCVLNGIPSGLNCACADSFGSPRLFRAKVLPAESSASGVRHKEHPFAPHLYFPQFLDDSDIEQRKADIGAGIVLLAECDELWAFGDKLTAGMRLELKVADGLSIPMRFFNDECEGEACLDGFR